MRASCYTHGPPPSTSLCLPSTTSFSVSLHSSMFLFILQVYPRLVVQLFTFIERTTLPSTLLFFSTFFLFTPLPLSFSYPTYTSLPHTSPILPNLSSSFTAVFSVCLSLPACLSLSLSLAIYVSRPVPFSPGLSPGLRLSVFLSQSLPLSLSLSPSLSPCLSVSLSLSVAASVF